MNVTTRRRLNLGLTTQGPDPEVPARRPSGPVLTAREQRVKDILLKELRQLNHRRDWDQALTPAERERLEHTLDVAYIDRELAITRKELRSVAKSTWLTLFPLLMVTFPFVITWWLGVLWFALLLILPWYVSRTRRASLRRRLFIYQALRELSDADELGIALDRITLEADALIARFTDHDLAPRRSSRPTNSTISEVRL
ncbi:MAG: hypothetical protein AAF970_17020 [Bacteroidota bacterium]